MKRLHSLLKGGMGAEVDWQILRGAITRSYKRRTVLCHLMILSQRIIASNVILDDSLKPSQLVVTLACKRVDSSIVGSKTKSIVFSQFVNSLDLIAFRSQKAGFTVSPFQRLFRFRSSRTGRVE
jgi:SNF2 family DNA or RNA helicase